MPFTEPTPITVNVTAADITNSVQGRFSNSLCQALIRLNAAFQLPGQEGETYDQGCAFYADTNLRLNNGQLIAICDAFVCTRVYSADLNTSIIIALENVSGIKPSAPYTATLVHN